MKNEEESSIYLCYISVLNSETEEVFHDHDLHKRQRSSVFLTSSRLGVVKPRDRKNRRGWKKSLKSVFQSSCFHKKLKYVYVSVERSQKATSFHTPFRLSSAFFVQAAISFAKGKASSTTNLLSLPRKH